MARPLQRITRLLRHLWLRDAVPPTLRGAALERLTQKVAQSEKRHSGQIRICLEGGLPASYLWRSVAARERAITLFGKLRVWDTEQNNGVLIYLLLADRAVEVVADRGLAKYVAPQQWEQLVASMAESLRSGNYEKALNHAVEEISALLEQQFPSHGSMNSDLGNELSDVPVIGPICS